MNKFKVLAVVLLVVLLTVGGVGAQDDAPVSPTPEAVEEVIAEATVEVTPVVEVPPVVVVESPSEDRLTLRELGLYAVVVVVVIAFTVILYRLVTMVGNSYPPGTSIAVERGREKAREFVASTPNKFDDLGMYVSEPVINYIIEEIRKREGLPPPGGSVG